MLSLTQTHFIRPMIKTRAKKDDYVEPAEAPGEGKRREPDVTDKKPEGVPPPTKPVSYTHLTPADE